MSGNGHTISAALFVMIPVNNMPRMLRRTVWGPYRLLREGLKVPQNIYERVRTLHPRPYRWFLGQYASFVLKFRKTTRKKVDSLRKKVLGLLDPPKIG